MARFVLLVTMMISSIPDAIASSTIYWIVGLSTIGSISFGIAFVAGKKRVPSPAAGIIAFFTFFIVIPPFFTTLSPSTVPVPYILDSLMHLLILNVHMY